jgi:hypothetical protein
MKEHALLFAAERGSWPLRSCRLPCSCSDRFGSVSVPADRALVGNGMSAVNPLRRAVSNCRAALSQPGSTGRCRANLRSYAEPAAGFDGGWRTGKRGMITTNAVQASGAGQPTTLRTSAPGPLLSGWLRRGIGQNFIIVAVCPTQRMIVAAHFPRRNWRNWLGLIRIAAISISRIHRRLLFAVRCGKSSDHPG